MEGAVDGQSDANGRGSGDAKRAGKERLAGVLVVIEPSSWLAAAMERLSPAVAD